MQPVQGGKSLTDLPDRDSWCSDRAKRSSSLSPSTTRPRLAQYLNERHPEPVPDEDPADLIREVLAIEKEITVGLENLLREVEQ